LTALFNDKTDENNTKYYRQVKSTSYNSRHALFM